MSATAAHVYESTLTDLALAYYAAEQARHAAQHSALQLRASAYVSCENAIGALREEGTRLDAIVCLESIAHGLASDYDTNRIVRQQLSEHARMCRLALGDDRSLARHLFALADDIGDVDDSDKADRVREVAEMIDAEDFT